MGREARGAFASGAEEKTEGTCVFRGPSRGLAGCDEGSDYNTQKQRAPPSKQQRKPPLLNSLLWPAHGTALRRK